MNTSTNSASVADAADASTSPPALGSAATPSEPCALPLCPQALAADALATRASAVLSFESVVSTAADKTAGECSQRLQAPAVISKLMGMRSLPYSAVNPHRWDKLFDEAAFFRALTYVEFEREHEISKLLAGDA